MLTEQVSELFIPDRREEVCASITLSLGPLLKYNGSTATIAINHLYSMCYRRDKWCRRGVEHPRSYLRQILSFLRSLQVFENKANSAVI
jgi:hypothetical protein